MAAAFRQITQKTFASSSATAVATFNSGTSAGSIIIVMSAADSALTGISFGDGNSDTYTDSGFGLVGPTQSLKYRIGAFLTPTTGTTTITATYSGTAPTFGEMYAYEVTGLTSAVVDKFVKASGGPSTTADSGSTGTLSSSDEACVAYGVTGGSGFTAAGSGWSIGQGSVVGTNLGDGIASLSTGDIGEHRVVAATTAINGTATLNSAGWEMACVTFMTGVTNTIMFADQARS